MEKCCKRRPDIYPSKIITRGKKATFQRVTTAKQKSGHLVILQRSKIVNFWLRFVALFECLDLMWGYIGPRTTPPIYSNRCTEHAVSKPFGTVDSVGCSFLNVKPRQSFSSKTIGSGEIQSSFSLSLEKTGSLRIGIVRQIVVQMQ